MKVGTKHTKRRCGHCGQPFSANERGRPRLYCRPSHRVRVHEKRREVETKEPTEKLLRLLKEKLAALARWRVRINKTPGIDEIRRSMGLERRKAYQQAVERVRHILTQLAPQVFQDLAEPWLSTLSGIEATWHIEQAEESAVGGISR